MITRPLDLRAHLRPPKSGINLLPVMDLLLIGLFFGLFWSDQILAPGLAIDLPEAGPGGDLGGLPASAVLTVRSNGMLLFEGNILSMENLESALATHLQGISSPRLLINFDREVSMQTLLQVSERVRAAGVERVVVAAKPGDAAGEEAMFR